MGEKLTTEELLKIATDGAQEEVVKPLKRAAILQRSVFEFIQELQIKIGKTRVATHVVYYLYKVVWGKARKNKVISKVAFFREFSKNFEQVRCGKQRFYLLDDLNIDQKTFNLAEDYARKETTHPKKRKKKVLKAVRHKVSSFDA